MAFNYDDLLKQLQDSMPNKPEKSIQDVVLPEPRIQDVTLAEAPVQDITLPDAPKMDRQLSSEKPASQFTDLMSKYNYLKTNPTPNETPIKNTISTLLGQSEDDLRSAKESRNLQQLFASLGQAGANIGAAITPLSTVKPDTAFYNKLSEQAEQPVSDLSKQRALNKSVLDEKESSTKLQTQMEQADPNSAISKLARDVYKMETGKDADPSLSYAAFAGIQSPLARISAAKESAQARKESRALASDNAKLQEASKLAQKMGTDLDADKASSRTALGRAALKKQSAEVIEAFVGPGKNLNELDSRQIQEIASAMDSMIKGGVGTVSGTEHLVPKTATGSGAKLIEWVMSNPTGAQQGKFVARMLESVQREKDLAEKQIRDYSKQKLPKYNRLKELDPTTYDQMLQQYGLVDKAETVNVIDPKGNVRIIPKDKLDAALKAGGKLVQ